MLDDVRSVVTAGTLAALVVLLAPAIGLAYVHGRARRHGRGFWSHLLAYASVALIVAVTLLRDGWPRGFWLGSLTVWSADGWQRLSSDPLASSQILLNVALFVPAGVFWTFLAGRPWRVLAALWGGALLIECIQAVFRVGAADVADLSANGAGAALGVLAGALILLIWPHPRFPRPSRGRVAATAGLLAAICASILVGIHLGATHRQQSLVAQAEATFAGTTLKDYREWEAADSLTEEVFDALPVFADGARYFDSSVEVRYPATFFGVHRCVFVAWSDAEVVVRPESGTACTEFIG